ncbi:MAG: fluoride efflux transporter CrcB [Pseudomonadota bacterium]
MNGVIVAFGGALGALLRWGTVQVVAEPLGTLCVNVIGSFLIGLGFVAVSSEDPRWHLFLITGLLGGFTTFSAFSLDALKLLEAGKLSAAFGYAAGSVLLSLAAAAFAIWIARSIWT